LVNLADTIPAALESVAQQLVGDRLTQPPEQVSGGRNSRIHRISTRHGRFALKQYFNRGGDPRDRLGAEVAALELLQQYGVGTVPHVLAVDRPRGFVLMTWIEGRPVTAPAELDIDRAADFLGAVHALRSAPEAQLLPRASEACLSGAEIERQILERLQRLEQRGPLEPDLGAFLRTAFTPVFEAGLARAKTRLAGAGIGFDQDLPAHWRSLIPADFGFHNCLRRPDGSLAVLDFEYFGWDDPAKLVADFLLHPGMPLTGELRERFRVRVARHYARDPCFADRLDALFPLFRLRWVLILLNEFLPDRWQQRLHAGVVGSWEEAKQRQLGRAALLLMELSTADGGTGQ
jgi:aminoglycoside phosphotransferase (APT) family kinase protein